MKRLNFLTVATILMVVVFGCSKTEKMVFEPVEIGEPASPPVITMLGKTVSELNAAGYKICGDFTRGFEELKNSYQIFYDKEYQFVLQDSSGAPVICGVEINAVVIDQKASKMGRIYFFLPFGMTRPQYPQKNNYGLVDANLLLKGYSDADSAYIRGDFYSPYSAGYYESGWKWIPMKKDAQDWKLTLKVVAEDTLHSNILTVKNGVRTYQKDELWVNSVEQLHGTITMSGNTITSITVDFLIHTNGVAVDVGRDHLRIGIIGINP